MKAGELTRSTVQSLVSVCRATGSRIALVGASTGGGLVILAAAHPDIADRVSAVAAIAPFASLRSLLRLATTGRYREQPFVAAPLLGRAAVRSLAASAPRRSRSGRAPREPRPQSLRRALRRARAATRMLVEELSPVTGIGDVRAPVDSCRLPTTASSLWKSRVRSHARDETFISLSRTG